MTGKKNLHLQHRLRYSQDYQITDDYRFTDDIGIVKAKKNTNGGYFYVNQLINVMFPLNIDLHSVISSQSETGQTSTGRSDCVLDTDRNPDHPKNISNCSMDRDTKEKKNLDPNRNMDHGTAS